MARAGVRSPLPDRLPDGNPGQPEADVVEAVRRRNHEAAGRPTGDATLVPGAAPAPPGRAPQLGAPLPQVAVHVAQPQLVRRVGADPRRSPQELPLWRLADGTVAVEIRLLRGQVVGRPVQVVVVRTFFL